MSAGTTEIETCCNARVAALYGLTPDEIRLVEESTPSSGRQGFQCFVSAINVGEVYYRLYRTRGTEEADTFWEKAWQGLVPLTIVTPTPDQIHQAARLKGR